MRWILVLFIIYTSITSAKDSIFQQHCALKYAKKEFCTKLETEFYRNKASIQVFKPKLVGAPKLPIDGKVKFVIFHDPKYLSVIGYCYFVQMGWIDMRKMTPPQLALAASGFAILKTEIKGYLKWIKSKKGRACKDLVKNTIGLSPFPIKGVLGDKESLIAINPISAITPVKKIRDIKREMQKTVNHERIHALHVSCPRLARWAKKEWNKLGSTVQKSFALRYPEYNWKNYKLAVREFLAFEYEDRPKQLLQHMGNCK